jgi:hypothetical protein
MTAPIKSQNSQMLAQDHNGNLVPVLVDFDGKLFVNTQEQIDANVVNTVEIYGNTTATIRSGDGFYFKSDSFGRMLTAFDERTNIKSAISTITNTSETSLLPAGGEGVFHDVIGLYISNGSAVSPVDLILRDAILGTIRLRIRLQNNTTNPNLIMENLFLNQLVANNNWTIQAVQNANPIYVTLVYIKRTA